MKQVVIRQLSDSAVEIHRRRALRSGRSLEAELRRVVEQAAQLSVEEKLELSRRIRAMTPVGIEQTPSEILIREDRDSR